MGNREELIEHIDSLYRTAFFMTKNKDDAEDLVQDTYFKAFKFLRDDTKLDHPKAWLCKILVNTFINKYRKDKAEPALVDFDSIESFHESVENEAFALPITEGGTKFEDLLDSEVKQALDSLPDDFRVAVLLSTVEGFSYEEISEMVKCPVGTVMSRIYRGRKMLKDKLADYAKKYRYGK